MKLQLKINNEQQLKLLPEVCNNKDSLYREYFSIPWFVS
jgi:hypothetical protein